MQREPEIERLQEQFGRSGGVLRAAQLKEMGLSSRTIAKLVEKGIVRKIRRGFYELVRSPASDEALLASMFPTSVVCLESALHCYRYTDRIPASWQIAVNKNVNKSQFDVSYPPIEVFYVVERYFTIGIDAVEANGVKLRLYDRERTICDVLRYQKKLDPEVFRVAVQRYVGDRRRNIPRLMEYAKTFRVHKKVRDTIGVWL